MANRTARRRTMKTSELREQAIEALDQTPYIDLAGDNDENVVVRIWHPLLVDDATQLRLERFHSNADVDKDEAGEIKYPITIGGKPAEPANIRSAKAILGDVEHKRFLKAGGHSNDVQLAWNEMVRVHEEAENILGVDEDAVVEDPK